MGLKYEEMINLYFQKKQLKERRAEVETKLLATSALQEVKQNRINYEKFKYKAYLQSLLEQAENE